MRKLSFKSRFPRRKKLKKAMAAKSHRSKRIFLTMHVNNMFKPKGFGVFNR